jgi:CBS domain-containing protein
MTAKSVKDLMTPDPTTVPPETSVSEAAEQMAREDVGPLPVVENDRLVGIVTDRDLVVRVLAEGRDPSSTTVREVASEELVTASVDDDLVTTLELLAKHQVRRVPVVDDGDRLVGIVAQADVAREVSSPWVGDVVEDISRDARDRSHR